MKKLNTHIAMWIGFVTILSLLIFIHSGRIRFSIFEKVALGGVTFYLNYLLFIPSFFYRKNKFVYFLVSLVALIFILLLPVFYHWLLSSSFHARRLFGRRFVFALFTQLFFLVAAIAVRVYEKWQENERKVQEAKMKNVESQLYSLKNQVNPHFLFNSLNSIYALTIKKSSQAPEAVLILSEMMRYMLYETDSEKVLLSKELTYIRNYIELQCLRVVDRRGIEFKVNGSVGSQRIAPLLFISFIENAFKFGVSSSGQMKIVVRFEAEASKLSFYCYNTVENKVSKKMGSGIGLQNAQKRLELLYPNNYDLQISENIGDYTVNLIIYL